MLTLVILGFLAASASGLNIPKFHQEAYKVISERMEVVNHNEKYIGNPQCRSFKYNNTDYAFNFSATVKRDLGNDLIADGRAYRLVDNEYKLFPIQMPINVCEALTINSFGMQTLYDCGNFFRCPITKGDYSLCNWYPDYTQFPPFIPRGRFMMDIKLTYKSKNILEFKWYVEIKEK